MARGCVCDRYGGKTAAEEAAGKPTCSERIAELEEQVEVLRGAITSPHHWSPFWAEEVLSVLPNETSN